MALSGIKSQLPLPRKDYNGVVRKKINKIVVLGAIFDNEGRLLVSQRHEPSIPDAHMKWDFVGGTKEENETLEDALHRELYEEAGAKVTIESFIPFHTQQRWKHKDYDQLVTVYCYVCKLSKIKTGIVDKKISKLKWIKRDDLNKLDFLITCKFFLPYILN